MRFTSRLVSRILRLFYKEKIIVVDAERAFIAVGSSNPREGITLVYILPRIWNYNFWLWVVMGVATHKVTEGKNGSNS